MIREEFVTLATGMSVPRAVLETTLISMRELSRHYPRAFHEIVSRAYDPDFELAVDTYKIARSRGLIVDRQMDAIIRDIIRAGAGEWNSTSVQPRVATLSRL